MPPSGDRLPIHNWRCGRGNDTPSRFATQNFKINYRVWNAAVNRSGLKSGPLWAPRGHAVPLPRSSDIIAVSMKQINFLYLALLALFVDIAVFVSSQFAFPSLVPKLQSPAGLNALLVSGTFLLFIVGVFIFRRMKATPVGTLDWLSRNQRVGLALIFAFVISLVIAWQLGFFESAFQVDTTQIGEGGSSSYFVYGPGAWLAFSMLYVLVFGFNVTPKFRYDGIGYRLAALFGLIVTDAMLLVIVAQGRAIMLDFGAVWWVAPAFMALILLFLPPRLLYLSRTVGLRSPTAYGVIAFFLLLLGVYAIQMTFTAV